MFSLAGEVVWGFNDPQEGKSNAQMVEALIKDFIDFLEKQKSEEG
jgi:hypothetical protein